MWRVLRPYVSKHIIHSAEFKLLDNWVAKTFVFDIFNKLLSDHCDRWEESNTFTLAWTMNNNLWCTCIKVHCVHVCCILNITLLARKDVIASLKLLLYGMLHLLCIKHCSLIYSISSGPGWSRDPKFVNLS